MIVSMLGWTGCAPTLPKAERPLEVQRVFRGSADETWDALNQLARASNGTIIASDRYSGLLVYSVPQTDGALYFQAYIRPQAGSNDTLVYLIPVRRWDSPAVVDGGTFLIHIHATSKAYPDSVEADFFNRLKTSLGGR